jgi:hypothetical protein
MSVPPVINEELAAAELVKRMPPEVIVFVPESVTVDETAALNRRLLVTEFAAGAPFVVIVVLLPEAHVSFV